MTDEKDGYVFVSFERELTPDELTQSQGNLAARGLTMSRDYTSRARMLDGKIEYDRRIYYRITPINNDGGAFLDMLLENPRMMYNAIIK